MSPPVSSCSCHHLPRRLRRKPIAENLFFGVGRSPEIAQPGGVDLLVTMKVLNRQLDRPRRLLADLASEFRLKAWAGFQQILYLGPRIADGLYPASTRLIRR